MKRESLAPASGWTIAALITAAFILIPFFLFGAPLESWSSAALAEGYGRWLTASLVVALLTLDILFPIPSSVVGVLSGSLLGPALGIGASFTGLTLGCLVGYWMGRVAGRPFVLSLVGAAELRRLETQFQKRGVWVIAGARAVPVVAEASVIAAGAAGWRFTPFLLSASLSNLGIAIIYASIGAYSVRANSFFLAVTASLALPFIARRWTRQWAPAPRRVGR